MTTADVTATPTAAATPANLGPRQLDPREPEVRLVKLLDPDTLNGDEALACLLAEPLLIRRPLMQCGTQHHLGFVTEAVHAWVGLGPSLATLSGPTGLEGCAHAHAPSHTDSPPPPGLEPGRCASPPPLAT